MNMWQSEAYQDDDNGLEYDAAVVNVMAGNASPEDVLTVLKGEPHDHFSSKSLVEQLERARKAIPKLWKRT